MTIREIAEESIAVIREKVAMLPDGNHNIVIADYTEEEFAELRKGEDYARYKAVQNLVADRLKEFGIADRVIFHKVDSVKYYHFLAEKKITHSQKALAYFASVDYQKSCKE